MKLSEQPVGPLGDNRGDKISLVNKALGTEKVDLHLNRLIPGAQRGYLHHHTNADNIYIVRKGEGTLRIEDQTYLIHADDIVYIPAGTRHSLSNLSDDIFETFEIYSPAGAHFDFVRDE